MRRSAPNADMTPHSRSAQSLGRKVFPARVSPRMTISVGLSDTAGRGLVGGHPGKQWGHGRIKFLGSQTEGASQRLEMTARSIVAPGFFGIFCDFCPFPAGLILWVVGGEEAKFTWIRRLDCRFEVPMLYLA